jgi:chaperonin GroES
MEITILKDYVLLKPDQQETKTKSGIILTEEKGKRANMGTIIQVKDGSEFVAGQRVIHIPYRGNEWTEGGETRLLLKEEDILARVVE